MTTSTPWGLPTDQVVTDTDDDRLRLLDPSTGADVVASRIGAALGGVARRPDRLVPAADVVLTAAILAAAPHVLGLDLGVRTSLLLGLGWIVALTVSDGWLLPSAGPRPGSVLRAGALLGLGCWAVDALLAPTASSRHLLVVTSLLVAAGLLVRVLATRSRPPTRVAVAGDAADVRRLLPELRRGPRSTWDVSSICVEADDPDQIGADLMDGTPVWAGTDALVAAARATGATAVVIAPGRAVSPEAARRLAWSAQDSGLEVLVATGLHDVTPDRARLVAAGSAALARLRPTRTRSARRALKELAERALAVVLLVALLPLMLVIAAIVSLDSPGGPFFRQQRVGRDQGTFTMYKFRTMTTDAETRLTDLSSQDEGDGVRFKIRQDPRITRIGAVLRRYSLDELPQLLNVLRGEMSLVGPRPALPKEVADYDEDSRHRLVVKPGLTGLWQVSGRSDLSWEESVRLDLHYVDNWSLGMDAHIVMRTAKAVIGHRGAY